MTKLLFLFLFCLVTGIKCEQYWHTCSKERGNCACAHKYLLASNPGVDVYDRVCVDPATGERLWDELYVPLPRPSHESLEWVLRQGGAKPAVYKHHYGEP